jgi:hypothetical protein
MTTSARDSTSPTDPTDPTDPAVRFAFLSSDQDTTMTNQTGSPDTGSTTEQPNQITQLLGDPSDAGSTSGAIDDAPAKTPPAPTDIHGDDPAAPAKIAAPIAAAAGSGASAPGKTVTLPAVHVARVVVLAREIREYTGSGVHHLVAELEQLGRELEGHLHR